MINKDGKIKSQAQLEHELNKLNVTYNNNYLEAERQFAISSAISADKWTQVNERYNLQYRTVNDNKVRDEHRVLHDITLPVQDEFWKKYYPPNGWRCRCVAVQVRKTKYAESDGAKAMELGDKATMQIGKDGKNRLEIFRFNPGASLKLMPPEHPYNKVTGADKVKEIAKEVNGINLKELIKKDFPTNAEIKNILNSYAEKFPEDFRNGLDQIKVQKSKSYMMQHSMAYRPSTGEWSGGSSITLSSNTFSIGGNAFNPLEELRGALGAIKKGTELTFNQEYAVESLWHEILHAKTKTKPFRLSSFQVQNMETINQFVARHSYSDFIERLGGKAYHKAEILDKGYGYSKWITDFRNELKRREIPEEKAVEFFTPHLMKEYSSLGTKIREFFNQQ
ncbi:MAG TPA: phage minor head protein [Flavobacterium sp.]|nr:phage minor head protein [Flavobacterium sp.]